jgi:hypothetical protein
MMTLTRADPLHFMDNAEQVHETFQTSNFGDQYTEIQRDVKPASQLVSRATAHAFANGLRVYSSARPLLKVDLKRAIG